MSDENLSFPREKAFYFFTSPGNYTGVSASSLKEFDDKLKEVNAKSLEFHLNRGDFEKWLGEVVKDNELAVEFRRLQKLDLSGDNLRNQMHLILSKRVKHPDYEQRVLPKFPNFPAIQPEER
jgi:hypothetical protein